MRKELEESKVPKELKVLLGVSKSKLNKHLDEVV